MSEARDKYPLVRWDPVVRWCLWQDALKWPNPENAFLGMLVGADMK